MPFQDVTYESYEDCFRSLTRMGVDERDVIESLDHEKQHFEKAKELGYNPVYGVRMIPDFPPPIDFYFIDWEGKEPKGQDRIDILLAPDQPSGNDLKLVEMIRSSLN